MKSWSRASGAVIPGGYRIRHECRLPGPFIRHERSNKCPTVMGKYRLHSTWRAAIGVNGSQQAFGTATFKAASGTISASSLLTSIPAASDSAERSIILMSR